MAKNNGQVNLGLGTFPAGTKVALHKRIGDARHGRPEKTQSVDGDGTLSFSGLKPGQQYYLVGEDELGREQTVAATAKGPAAEPRQPRDPDNVRHELVDRALDQGSTNAEPVEGMRSSASVAPRDTELQKRNRETMESAARTAKALKGQDLSGAQIDRLAVETAGVQTTVGPSGEPRLAPGESTDGADDAAAKRSAASKKAAATRRRNAEARKAAAQKAARTRAAASGTKKK